MLLREGEARTGGIDKRLAVSLTAVAGALNAAAFHAAGFFAANMTGNVSLLSERLATGGFGIAGFLLAVIVAFVAGAWTATAFVAARRRRGAPAAYAWCIVIEAALLTILGVTDLAMSGNTRVAVLIIGLSFLMGLQNAVATRISGARVRTTHVSGTLTDIGIELAYLFGSAQDVDGDEHAAMRARLGLHLSTVAAFCVGGVVGVIAYEEIGGGLLILAALLLAIFAAPAALRRKSIAR